MVSASMNENTRKQIWMIGGKGVHKKSGNNRSDAISKYFLSLVSEVLRKELSTSSFSFWKKKLSTRKFFIENEEFLADIMHRS